jgi:hypothetical protein
VDGHKFDTLSRALATGSSRRQLLGAVAGSLIAAVGGRQPTQAKRNNECAKLCKSLFGPGKDRGQCISAGARGRGPCAAPPPACPQGQHCSGGRCCDAGFVACPGNPTGCIPESTACSGLRVCCDNNGAGPGILCGSESQCQAGSAPPPATCPPAGRSPRRRR